MAGFTVIADISEHLIQLIRAELYPALLNSPEEVILSSLNSSKTDSMYCLSLYSVCEQMFNPPERTVSLTGTVHHTAVGTTLKYVFFPNPNVQSPVLPQTEYKIIGKILALIGRTNVIDITKIHNNADSSDSFASVRFSGLDDKSKTDIWNAHKNPMPIGVYFEVDSLNISCGTQAVTQVTDSSMEVFTV